MKKSNNTPPDDGKSEHTNRKIAQKIKGHRENNGLSRTELSEKSGIDLSEIDGLENGDGTPTMLTYLKLAAALEVRLSDIIHEADGDLPE